MKSFAGLFLFILLSLASIAQTKGVDYFLQNAKYNSPLVRDYNNQISVLSLDSFKLRSSLLPQVNGSSSLYYAPVIRGVGYDQAISNGQLVSSLITVNKDITPNSRVNTLIQSIKISKDSLGVQRLFTLRDIEKNITTQYINTWGSQQNLNLAQQTLDLLKKQDAVLKKLTQAAIFKQTEYLNFKISLEQQALAVLQGQSQYKNDFYTLYILSGIKDTAVFELAPIAFDSNNDLSFDKSLVSKKFEIDSLRNLNSLKQLDYNYQPKVNVFADAGYQSSLPANYYQNFGWSLGLNLSIPIYDGGLKKLSTQQLKLNQLTQNNYKNYYASQFDLQKNQLQRMIIQYDDLIENANKQLIYSKTLVDANALQITSGEIRMTDYLLSISNYLNLQSTIIQNKITQLQMINQLHYFTLK